MKYIHAIKGSVLAFVIFCLIAYFAPNNGPSNEIEIILTVSTFLFAIIAGFFISRFNSRYDKIRELISKEDSYWLSFYNTCTLFGKKFVERVTKIIDEYYIISYDFDLGSYYQKNMKQMNLLYEEIGKLNFPSILSNVHSDLVNFLAIIEENRNESSVLTEERMTLGQWALLFILSGIVVFSIFYLRVSSLYSQVIAILLSTALVLILLTLRDLQNLRLGGRDILVESGHQNLERMGVY